MTKEIKIWIWLYNDHLMKAISSPQDGTLCIYDEHDNILIKRTGLTPAQIKKIECVLSTLGINKIKNDEPVTYH